MAAKPKTKVDRKRDRRSIDLLRKYGITADDYDAVAEHQDGRCAICRRPPKNYRLAVDHEHKTGGTRGLLCWICNKVLAYLADDAERAARATDYLNHPPARAALGRWAYGYRGRVGTKKFRRALRKAIKAGVKFGQLKAGWGG